MGRVYGEPVDVQSREDGRPTRFVWRGRLYTVRAITAHRVVNFRLSRESGQVPAQPDQEYWRVEASPGQGVPAGAFELRRDVAADTWTLRRV